MQHYIFSFRLTEYPLLQRITRKERGQKKVFLKNEKSVEDSLIER